MPSKMVFRSKLIPPQLHLVKSHPSLDLCKKKMKLQEQMFGLIEKWKKSDLVKHEFLAGTEINNSKSSNVKNIDFQELRIPQKLDLLSLSIQ